MSTKAMARDRATSAQRTTQPAKSSPARAQTAAILQRAQKDPSTLSPSEVFHLQSTLGNQAVMRMLNAPDRIQRDGDDDDDGTPLLGGHGVASDEYEGDEEESAEDAAKISKLQEIGNKMALFYAMHKNYQKYSAYLGSKAWNLFNKAWSLANKVIGYVKYIDPSGITAIVEKVSKAVKLIADYVTEAVLLADAKLQEEVTPLLAPSITVGMVKDAAKEAKSIVTTVKDAIEALV